jgi:hypothetical protein
MADSNGIVADGYWRARKALAPQIREEVQAEYATKVQEASPSDRRRLERELEREIERRIREKAPPDALY